MEKLSYTAEYGSPRCEKGFISHSEKIRLLKEELDKHKSKLWELERKAGMHPPLSKELPY
jgi:hypothetical protein